MWLDHVDEFEPHTSLVPQTMCESHRFGEPQTLRSDHAASLLSSAGPQMVSLRHTRCCAHLHASPAIVVTAATLVVSQLEPTRLVVSIARASSIAPAALISPVPCVSAS